MKKRNNRCDGKYVLGPVGKRYALQHAMQLEIYTC